MRARSRTSILTLSGIGFFDFAVSAVINKEKQHAWIRRKGGFVYVDEWYGPVKLSSLDLGGCKVEPWR